MVYLSDCHRLEALRPGKDSDLDQTLLPASQQCSSPIAPVPQMIMSSDMEHPAGLLSSTNSWSQRLMHGGLGQTIVMKNDSSEPSGIGNCAIAGLLLYNPL